MILVPAFAAPLRLPAHAWAMRVLAVGILGDAEPDRAGEVDLFAGSWLPEPAPPAGGCDGDLVVRLTHPADPTCPWPRDHAADVEMLLAYRGRWQRVGRWGGLDDRWPRVIAPTAATVMGLHADTTENTTPMAVAGAPPPGGAGGGIADLLTAGLVSPEDEWVWHRRNLAVRHTAHLRADGKPWSWPMGGCSPTRRARPPRWAA